jgi:leucyl aminopeptidase
MQDLTPLLQPDKGQPATDLHLVDKKGLDEWLKAQPERARRAVEVQSFKAEGYQLATLPGGRAEEWSAVLGVANAAEPSVWCLSKAADVLPAGTFRLAGRGPGPAVLGWLLGQYRFDRYKKEEGRKGPRVLLTDEPARIEETLILAQATHLVRDLVNIPAQDMGPMELESAVVDIAKACSAATSTTSGPSLETEFPMVHAVGRAASPDRAPRMIELLWGNPSHPRIAIVGKGVCFDTGGLDIKPSAGMLLMKKDMGGAAHALALAYLIMNLWQRLPPRRYTKEPQGPDRRDRQYGRRRTANPRGRPDPCLRRGAGADPRLRHSHRRSADRARSRPSRSFRQ